MLAIKKASEELIQAFIELNRNDKIILTSKLVNEELKNHHIEVEYFKVLPEPFENFNLHFKVGNLNKSVSIASSITRGNFIGFEAIHSVF